MVSFKREMHENSFSGAEPLHAIEKCLPPPSARCDSFETLVLGTNACHPPPFHPLSHLRRGPTYTDTLLQSISLDLSELVVICPRH